MQVERIALFGLDFPNIINQIMGLRDGFRQLGVEVLTAWPHPNALVLENILDSFKPDFVFEINRSRNQIPECEEKFVHICWMQDIQSLGKRLDVDFGGSDLSYFLLPPGATGYGGVLDDSVRYLMPGCNPEIFFAKAEPPIFDFSFVGQMFAPLSEELRGRTITVGGLDCGTVGALAEYLKQQGVSLYGRRSAAGTEELLRFLRHRNPEAELSMVSPAILNFCDEYFPRLQDRRRMLDTVLTVSSRVGFFGTGPWEMWPEFSRHFGGYINRPSKLALVYRRTRVNLHNAAVGVHPRVFDCMASGGAILVNKSPYDGTPHGLDWYFEAGRHYIEYDIDTLAETAANALSDEARRRRLGAAAAAAVRAGHTWRDRAAQIIEDAKSL